MKTKISNEQKMIRMEQILREMKKHLTENLKSEQVAEKFGYSVRYFETIFKEYFGIPFSKYMTKLRLRYAAVQLLTNHPMVGTLNPNDFGYANSSSFSKAFRKEFGISPGDFIKEYQHVPDILPRKKLFGKEIAKEYCRSSELNIAGYGVYITDEEIPDLIEFAINTAAWALDHPVEKIDLDAPGEWYGLCWHDEKIDHGLYYVYASPIDSEKNLPPDYTSIHIPSMNCVIFSCEKGATHAETAQLCRLLVRYVLKEWRIVNDKKEDKMGWFYQKFDGERFYVYLPLLEDDIENLPYTNYGTETWISYIDEHILEDLKVKDIADAVHYSVKNFNNIFRLYYIMSPAEYILKRRLYMAAQEVRKGASEEETAAKYRFRSAAKFRELFQRKYGVTLEESEQIKLETVNLPQYYEEYKNTLRIAIREMGEQMMIGKGIQTREDSLNVPGYVDFWFRNDFESIQQTSYACPEPGMEDKGAIWDETLNETTGKKEYHYVVGPFIENTDEIPADMKLYTIPGGIYAIFTTKDQSDESDIAEKYRMMTRCVFWGWVHENKVRMDWERDTFVRYCKKKLYFYVPLIG